MFLYPLLTLKCTVGLVFIVNGALQVFMYVCMYVIHIIYKVSSEAIMQNQHLNANTFVHASVPKLGDAVVLFYRRSHGRSRRFEQTSFHVLICSKSSRCTMESNWNSQKCIPLHFTRHVHFAWLFVSSLSYSALHHAFTSTFSTAFLADRTIGRAFGTACRLFVCLSVCRLWRFVCDVLYPGKTAGPICMKFSGKVWSDHGTTSLHFGSIRVNRAMPRY